MAHRLKRRQAIMRIRAFQLLSSLRRTLSTVSPGPVGTGAFGGGARFSSPCGPKYGPGKLPAGSAALPPNRPSEPGVGVEAGAGCGSLSVMPITTIRRRGGFRLQGFSASRLSTGASGPPRVSFSGPTLCSGFAGGSLTGRSVSLAGVCPGMSSATAFQRRTRARRCAVHRMLTFGRYPARMKHPADRSA